MITDRPGGIKTIRAFDVLLILLLLAVAAAAWFLPRAGRDGAVAVVSVAGEEYTRIVLSEAESTICFSVNGVWIKISTDGAMITDSDCPDKTCVKTGKISSPGEAAVCVPNKVIVYIEGRDSDVDGVAY
ncbi:MAG: NusG domain II-containing protein [Clostridia bacterium]|nr:NusG domain II-containing protein [Clostridia bacterium]